MAWDVRWNLVGSCRVVLQSCPLVSGQTLVRGWLALLSHVCVLVAMPGPPIKSIWQHSGGRCANKALMVFMVPAASLASSRVSSAFVWDFLGAHANFFKIVKGWGISTSATTNACSVETDEKLFGCLFRKPKAWVSRTLQCVLTPNVSLLSLGKPEK